MSSTSAAPAKGLRGGVGGALSAYEAESESPLAPPDLLEDHDIDGNGASGSEVSRAVVNSLDGGAGEYGGGAVLMTVPGKYRGTNGAGPCIGGPSSDASVWKELTDGASPPRL